MKIIVEFVDNVKQNPVACMSGIYECVEMLIDYALCVVVQDLAYFIRVLQHGGKYYMLFRCAERPRSSIDGVFMENLRQFWQNHRAYRQGNVRTDAEGQVYVVRFIG